MPTIVHQKPVFLRYDEDRCEDLGVVCDYAIYEEGKFWRCSFHQSPGSVLKEVHDKELAKHFPLRCGACKKLHPR